MAAAFDRAGFAAVDVHMSDILAGRVTLADFKGSPPAAVSPTATCSAPAKAGPSPFCSTRGPRRIRGVLRAPDSFGLGVCNGCQMMSNLQELIPGSELWPRFVRNGSEQFEARLAMVEVLQSPSLFLRGMAGSRMPIAVAHGEGRAEF